MVLKKAKGRPLRKKLAVPKGQRPEGWIRTDVTLLPVDQRPANDSRYPECSDKRMPTEATFFAVDKNGNPESFVTRLANGTYIAWSWCGACRMPMGSCGCTHGPLVSRAVEHLWDKTNAEEAGEYWSYNHKNYRGSYRERGRKEHTRKEGRYIMPPARSTPAPATTSPKPAQQPKKPLRKRDSSALTATGLDRKQTDKAAANIAEQATKQLIKNNTKPKGKKPLKRRR